MLKAVVVTSRLHFVPGNYVGFLAALANCPQVHGLIVLDNLNAKYLIKAAAFGAAGATRIGKNLTKNYYRALVGSPQKYWESRGKKFWKFDNINEPEVSQLIRNQGIDLLVNARTRFIYKKGVLGSPNLGCINIHHGLLPEQRGTMCDLWSLASGKEAGFSIHVMNQKIDDGGIIGTYTVESGKLSKNYESYLKKSALIEAKAIKTVLSEIECTGKMPPVKENKQRESAPHFRNPTLKEIRMFRRKGILL